MSIKDRNSVANLQKFFLIQGFMHVLVTCKNKKNPIKMKALECSQDFFHYKSMGIFPDASGLISNPFETLWLSSLPAKMKKIRSKM